MSMTRMVLFLALTVYLVIAGVFVVASADYVGKFSTSTKSKEAYMKECDKLSYIAGFAANDAYDKCVADYESTIQNNDLKTLTLLTDYSTPYAWLTLILIGIPFAFWLMILASFAIPFLDGGG